MNYVGGVGRFSHFHNHNTPSPLLPLTLCSPFPVSPPPLPSLCQPRSPHLPLILVLNGKLHFLNPLLIYLLFWFLHNMLRCLGHLCVPLSTGISYTLQEALLHISHFTLLLMMMGNFTGVLFMDSRGLKF
ncbi:hypothetical protein ACSQ67_001592 [Phaseolus vulgaris]